VPLAGDSVQQRSDRGCFRAIWTRWGANTARPGYYVCTRLAGMPQGAQQGHNLTSHNTSRWPPPLADGSVHGVNVLVHPAAAAVANLTVGLWLLPSQVWLDQSA
jgi:hypothetical protein